MRRPCQNTTLRHTPSVYWLSEIGLLACSTSHHKAIAGDESATHFPEDGIGPAFVGVESAKVVRIDEIHPVAALSDRGRSSLAFAGRDDPGGDREGIARLACVFPDAEFGTVPKHNKVSGSHDLPVAGYALLWRVETPVLTIRIEP